MLLVAWTNGNFKKILEKNLLLPEDYLKQKRFRKDIVNSPLELQILHFRLGLDQCRQRVPELRYSEKIHVRFYGNVLMLQRLVSG